MNACTCLDFTGTSLLASRVAALIVACAGCWEKIEYTGPRTPSATPHDSVSSPVPTGHSSNDLSNEATSNSVADAPPVIEEAPPLPPTASPPETPTVPTAATETPPHNPAGDDRYTTPVVESPPAAEPSNVAAPAAESEIPNPYAEADPSRHTDATPVSATAAADQPASGLNSRRAAWLLGSRLSLAALAHDRGIAAKNVPVWFADTQAAAKLLGTTVLDLPEPADAGDTAPASSRVINYLVVSGQRIGPELSKRQGQEQSALFEIALKSNILLLLYSPGTSAGSSIAAAISRAAPQAKLPAELWQPLVVALNKQAPQTEVRAAVRKMHIDVEKHLSQPAEQNGR